MKVTKNWWGRKSVLAGLSTAFVLWALPGIALAQEAIDRRVLTVGEFDYGQYCASCHGKQGKGDGEMAEMLKAAPTDLTQLSKKSEGQYPFWRVFRTIDGRDSLEAHGRDMPLWGEVFQTQEGTHPLVEADVVGRILALNFYIQSLQAK